MVASTAPVAAGLIWFKAFCRQSREHGRGIAGCTDMTDHALSYFESRAEAELEMAQRATHPAAVYAHYTLADLYLDRVYGDEPGNPSKPPGRAAPARAND
jgi:hypothetical protein